MNDYKYSYGIIRILACICVIIHHYINAIYFDYSGINQLTLLVIDNLCMVNNSLFFMLSGKFALEYFSGSVGKYYWKRFIKIVCPFLFIRLGLYIIASNEKGIGSIFEFGYKLTHREIEDWFVFAVIGFYIVVPFFSKMMKSLSERMKIAFLCLLIVYLSINSFNECIDNIFYVAGNPFIGNFSFFLFGYLIDNISCLRNVNKGIYAVSGLIAAAISCAEIVFFPTWNPSIYGYCLTRFVMCVAIFICIGWQQEMRLPRVMLKKIEIVADLTFYVYLLHGYVQEKVLGLLSKWNINVYVKLCITSILIFILSAMLSFIIQSVTDLVKNTFFMIKTNKKNVS